MPTSKPSPPSRVSVAAFVYTGGAHPRFLLLKRVEALGGFWQPITGVVDDGESPRDAVVREVAEESGIRRFTRVTDLDYAYDYPANGQTCTERCFAMEVAPDTPVTLSDEHTTFCWRDYAEATRLLFYQEYRDALERLKALLSDGTPPAPRRDGAAPRAGTGRRTPRRSSTR